MAYSNELHTHYIALVTRPVSEGSYAGEDARFSAEFEAIEQELAKAQSLHGAGPVDWLTVQKTSEHVLQAVSKDLRVACWLAWALYQTESLPGLMAGCAMLGHLCSEHWDSVFPLKARTRGAALGWFISRLDQALAQDIAVKERLSLFEELSLCLEQLDHVLTTELKDEAPLLLPLRRRLTVMIQKAHEVVVPSVSLVEQVKQVAASLVTPAATVDSEKAARSALQALRDGARPLCGWWLRTKASDIRALRLNRTVTWLGVEKLPEHDGELITGLKGISPKQIEGFRARMELGHHADLMVELEATLSNAPFWFDGHHMVWQCLRALNAQAAVQELEILVALFVARLPMIIELRFQDGEPFADSSTRAWVAEQVMPRLEMECPIEPEDSPARPLWESVREEALPMLRTEGLKAVIGIFKQHMKGVQGGRDRFYWNLSLAQICYQAKKYELAKNQLETLDEQLTHSGLAVWEPDLQLKVLRLLHRCCELLPQNKVVREHKDELYRRLCHLDVEAVLEQA